MTINTLKLAGVLLIDTIRTAVIDNSKSALKVVTIAAVGLGVINYFVRYMRTPTPILELSPELEPRAPQNLIKELQAVKVAAKAVGRVMKTNGTQDAVCIKKQQYYQAVKGLIQTLIVVNQERRSCLQSNVFYLPHTYLSKEYGHCMYYGVSFIQDSQEQKQKERQQWANIHDKILCSGPQ